MNPPSPADLNSALIDSLISLVMKRGAKKKMYIQALQLNGNAANATWRP
jgi:hypothetical protein